LINQRRNLIKFADIVVVNRWIPILKEYERTKAKVAPRPFKFAQDLSMMNGSHFINGLHGASLAVISDFDIKSIAVFKSEAYAPPFVDTNAPLPCAVTMQGFQSVAGQNMEIFNGKCC
jgi:hypothetical protein